MLQRDIRHLRNIHDKNFEPHRYIQRCIMVGVDFDNDPRVDGRQGYVWVQELGSTNNSVFQVFNPTVQRRVNMAVLVGPDPQDGDRRVVYGVDWTIVLGGAGYADPFLPNHAVTHEWVDAAPGADAITVYPRAFAQLRTYVSTVGAMYDGGMSVGVYEYRLFHNGVFIEYDGEDPISLATYVPPNAGEWRYVLVYLDTLTWAAAVVAGSIVQFDHTPTRPNCPAYGIPSAYIILRYGATTISEANIYDARFPFWSEAERTVFGRPVELTIANETITITGSYHTVLGRAGLYSDNLDTVNGGADGQLLCLQNADGDFPITLRNAVGNILTPDGNDYTLDIDYEITMLVYNATDDVWMLIGGAGGGDSSANVWQHSDDNVSNPPTDAELDTAFGTPVEVGDGYMAILDDAGAGVAVYLVASDGTNWWHTAMTKAL